MFIIICQDVIEKAIHQEGMNHQDAIEVLKKLLLSVKWRKHIVFAPDMSEENIDNLGNILTNEEKVLLKHIHNHRTNSNLLMGTLSIIVKVTFEEETRKENSTIYVKPTDYKDFEFYEETHFIVENILDAKFYDIINKYFMRENPSYNKYFCINYYPVQGGGATIAEVIRGELNLAQHFCFVIGDSDKICKNSEEGNTAQNIRSVIGNENPFNMDFYIMSKVREIENLIPFCILNLIPVDKAKKDFLGNHQKSNNLSFYDMKIGIDYKKIYDSNIYDEYKRMFPVEFEWEIIDEIKNNAGTKEEFAERLEEFHFLNYNWGKTILKKVIDLPEKNYKLYDKIKKCDLTPNQKEEWDEIGKLVFSWCCCFANPPR